MSMDLDSAMAPPAAPETAQIKVLFTTTDASLELPEAKRQLLVPAGESRREPHNIHPASLSCSC
jgi:hypothetical protein